MNVCGNVCVGRCIVALMHGWMHVDVHIFVSVCLSGVGLVKRAMGGRAAASLGRLSQVAQASGALQRLRGSLAAALGVAEKRLELRKGRPEAEQIDDAFQEARRAPAAGSTTRSPLSRAHHATMPRLAPTAWPMPIPVLAAAPWRVPMYESVGECAMRRVCDAQSATRGAITIQDREARGPWGRRRSCGRHVPWSRRGPQHMPLGLGRPPGRRRPWI